jgi:hypothetical protein
MAINAFVVSSGAGISSTEGNECKSVLGFRNIVQNSTYTIPYPMIEDPLYPFSLASDNKTNTEFSLTNTSGTCSIELNQLFPSVLSYFGLFSKNAGDCELSFSLDVQNSQDGTWSTVVERGSFKDGNPQMVTFAPVLSQRQYLNISFTKKPYISSISLGEAVTFTRNTSVGFSPGRNHCIDEVATFETDGNNFIQGRRLRRGNQETGEVSAQVYDWVDTWWAEYMNHVLDSKPIWFMANNQYQTDVIFGNQSPDKVRGSKYKDSVKSENIAFEIKGWTR